MPSGELHFVNKHNNDEDFVRRALIEVLSLLGEDSKAIVFEYIDPPSATSSASNGGPLTPEEAAFALHRFFGSNADSMIELFNDSLRAYRSSK